MHVEYKRNLQNNYMIMEAEEEPKENYCLHMAENNQIPGLLSFHSTRTDGRLYIQYEITSKQPMEQIYGKKGLSGEQLYKILTEVSNMLETVQKYLLNPSHILFDPKYVYVSAEDRTLQFCYLPGKEHTETIQVLAEFFLKHLDHEDLRAVEIGYLFYQNVQEENYSLKQILKKILYENKAVISEKDDFNTERKKREIPNIQNHEWKTDTADSRNEKYEAAPDETDSTMYDVYKVTHKERTDKHSERWIDRLFLLVHPAVLLTSLIFFAVIEILYYFRIINLTEAGGMFFLVISVEMLGNQIWKKRKNKKEEQAFRWISEEEEAMYRILQEEMYDDSFTQNRADNTYENRYKKESRDAVSEQDPGETRYLGEIRQIPELRLIPVVNKENNSRKLLHPEIVVRNESLLIGKRKGESDIILDSPTVSRTHAMLERNGDMYYVCDLNSKNGTFCNGERLIPQEKCRIQQEDLIAFAELEYRAVLYSSNDSL